MHTTTADQRMRTVAGAATLALALAPPALASEPVACLDSTVEAETPGDEILAALRIETRKSGLAWQWTLPAEGGTCPADRPVVSFHDPTQAILRIPDAEPIAITLESVPAAERPRSLARTVAFALSSAASGSSGRPLVLLDDDLGGATTEPTRRLEPWLRLGGRHLRQTATDRGTTGPAAEVGVDLWGGRAALSAGGSLAWGPGTTVLDLETGPLRETELLLMARGGFVPGPLLVRVGAGAGWYRGTLEADAFVESLETLLREDHYGYRAFQEQTEELDTDERLVQASATVSAELEVLRRLWGHWDLGLQLGGRYLPAAAAYGVHERRIMDAAPWAWGAGMTLGYRL